jgi:hypothetical protein
MTKSMQLDGTSIIGTLLTCLFSWIAHITGSDVALTITIIAGLSTILVNVKKLRKK